MEINVKEIVNMCGFFLWNITKGLCQKRIECQFISSLSVSKLSSKKQKDSNVTRVWYNISTVDSRLILVSCKSNPCLNVWNMIYLMVMTSLGMSLILSALMSHFMDEASLTIRSACVTFYFHFLLFFKAKIFARRETEGKMASPIHISKPPRKPIWKEMKRVLNGTTNLFQAQIVKQTEYQKHLSSFPNFRLSLTLGIFQILGHQEFFWREKNHIILKV